MSAETNLKSRRERRAIAKGGGVYDTALLRTAEIAGHPKAGRFRPALSDWYRGPTSTCVACRLSFGVGRVPAMFLFAIVTRSTVSVAAVCTVCAAADDPEFISAGCERVLGRLVEGGRFLDPINKSERPAGGRPSGP